MLPIKWVIYHISHNFLIIFFPLLVKFFKKINISVHVVIYIYFAPEVLDILPIYCMSLPSKEKGKTRKRQLSPSTSKPSPRSWPVVIKTWKLPSTIC
jgi:hypothetical protein